ncbi:LysR family transcriptional regulator [Uliginosibacterium gangwonense]|uniref:LysR family transcriptional regulator n=1 Tax=Uliginosibacterium gangwonense TaxID=392736 RepID=UPI000360476D|nr:LysR family transcriptional regulator [Uliginosibacterium gangwonense]
MLHLEDLNVFIHTAKAGSLSAAAKILGYSPASASAALVRLEKTLGQCLLLRTTRNMRLSPAGERYLPHALEALRVLEAGRASLSGESSTLRGQLRIGAPSDLGRNTLREWLDEFTTEHPALELRLQVGDRLSNLFREPVDVALRYGKVRDESLVASPLLPANRRVPVASPAYLGRMGKPVRPHDLAQHTCVLYTVEERADDRWKFLRGDEAQTVLVQGRRIADDGEVVRRWALDGHGIACLSQIDVIRDILAGRLVWLLPDWQGERTPLHFVCPHRSILSPSVISLKQWLSERLTALSSETGSAST